MKKIINAITHPLTLCNFILVGSLVLIQVVHTHAHYKMEIDVHGYCANANFKNETLDTEEDW